MNYVHNMRITHDILVATINEGLARKSIRLSNQNNKAINLEPNQPNDPSQASIRRFSFLHADTKMHASFSYDENDGVVITVVLIGSYHSKSDCAGVVVGRLYPASLRKDPETLMLDCGAYCCNGIIPHQIFSMKHENPNGYSLIMP